MDERGTIPEPFGITATSDRNMATRGKRAGCCAARHERPHGRRAAEQGDDSRRSCAPLQARPAPYHITK